MPAEFYGCPGAREVLTFITEGEKPPALTGFSMNDSDVADLPEHAHQDEEDQQEPDTIAPEDVQGQDIEASGAVVPLDGGRDNPADGVVVNAADFEKIVVNGVELSAWLMNRFGVI